MDKLVFNGVRYHLDLCEKHSLEMFTAMMKWADLGTKVGETSSYDQQQPVRDVTFDLTAPAKPAAEVEAVQEEPVAPVTPIRKVLAGDPELPLTASRWQLSAHAEDQRKERGFTLAEVLWACERPEWAASSKDVPNEDRAGTERRTKDRCTAVVDPHSYEVITVLYAAGVERPEREAQA